MKTYKDLREALMNMAQRLNDGTANPEHGHSLARVGKTIIRGEVAAVNYQIQRGEPPKSEFFDGK